MKKIETNSKTIHRYDNVMSPEICNFICHEALKIFTNDNKNLNFLPWHDGDTNSLILFRNSDIAHYVHSYIKTATNLINSCYNTNSYPEFIDFVLWRKGRKMNEHADNCTEHFKKRIFSTVLYLNDNYTGGETFIKTETNTTYISKPKQGTMVSFLSDETNLHGVNEILEGIRFTLPIWFGVRQLN